MKQAIRLPEITLFNPRPLTYPSTVITFHSFHGIELTMRGGTPARTHSKAFDSFKPAEMRTVENDICHHYSIIIYQYIHATSSSSSQPIDIAVRLSGVRVRINFITFSITVEMKQSNNGDADRYYKIYREGTKDAFSLSSQLFLFFPSDNCARRIIAHTHAHTHIYACV